MIPSTAVPVEIERCEGFLRVGWSTEHESLYPYRQLRASCSCASCVHEWTGQKLIHPEQVPNDIHPSAIEAVGRYAISIHWSDGHNTGIYPFDYLKGLCPCTSCTEARASNRHL